MALRAAPALAGLDMGGVDRVDQPHYPFEFIRDDALPASARMVMRITSRGWTPSLPASRSAVLGCVMSTCQRLGSADRVDAAAESGDATQIAERRVQLATAFPTDQLIAGRKEDRQDGSHVTLGLHDGVGAQLCPCSIATTAQKPRCALKPSPYRSDLSWWADLRGVLPPVSHVHLSALLAGLKPFDGSGPSRRSRGTLSKSCTAGRDCAFNR